MKYTVRKIENPPPPPKNGRGGVKGELRLALEAMRPGDAIMIEGLSGRQTGPFIAVAKKATGFRYRMNTVDGGCMVWCLDAITVQP